MSSAPQDPPSPTAGSSLVFVLGPGRSGTSTMAGALSHSGYTVPGAIKGNATNPSGFFEPRWAVNFHRRLLRQTGVRTLDSDPEVMSRLEPVLTDPAVRAELEEWLAPKLEQSGRIVIKDPRMVWFRDLWVDVAQGLGVEPGFVFMLRHPSEVASSRSSYYNGEEVVGVAGWVNVALMTERLTAGSPRALVLYPSLTSDWRAEMVRVRDQLGLTLDPAPEVSPHPVDDFIDPSLRRMKPGWEDSDVPAYLQELGDRTFDTLLSLTDSDAPDVTGTLDQLREEYARAHAGAYAMVRHKVLRDREAAATKARAKVRKRLAAKKAAAPAASPPPAPASFVRRAARSARRRLRPQSQGS